MRKRQSTLRDRDVQEFLEVDSVLRCSSVGRPKVLFSQNLWRWTTSRNLNTLRKFRLTAIVILMFGPLALDLYAQAGMAERGLAPSKVVKKMPQKKSA